MKKPNEMIAKATLRPGQKGTKHLVEKYGDRLLRVRYRYDTETSKRYTTVELIEAEAEWVDDSLSALAVEPPAGSFRVGVRIGYGEADLREKVKKFGAIWRPNQRLWEMTYETVAALGLEARIADQSDADGI